MHIFDGNIGPLPMENLRGVESMRLLADGSEIQIHPTRANSQYGEYLYINFGEDPNATYPLPNDKDTVIEIILKE